MQSKKSTIKRYFKLELPIGQSAFLWGARKTGKSTYLKQHFPNSVYYDLLNSEEEFRLAKSPEVFRQEVLALSPDQLTQPIIIDEVQKVPKLLDEIHWLIENSSAYFILCGSSARKLKRGAANLLGGRAWRFTFYPLVYPEIRDVNLLQALNAGLVPSHYLSSQPRRQLKAYIIDYLSEEIQAEGLVRNLPAFARFLDVAGHCNGEMLNYSNIATDCGVDSKTIREYFQILVDTLIGYLLSPYTKKSGRDTIIAAQKFYFFDIGIVNILRNRAIAELKGENAGAAFEHYIFMELKAYLELNELEYNISYWRTKTGLEVDFVIGDHKIAIEVKISTQVKKSEIKGLLAFVEDYKPHMAIVVSQDPKPRKLNNHEGTDILVLPWQDFLKRLWSKKII